MRKEISVAFSLGACLIVWGFSATPVGAQNLLDRLQERVRERLGPRADDAVAPQPVSPPTLQAPPTSRTPDAERATTREEPAATPRLGLEAEEQGSEFPYQLFVNGVRPGTPAAEAGVRPGDLILQVDGRDVGSIDMIAEVLRTKRPGDSIRIRARRGDRPVDLIATLSGAEDSQTDGQRPPVDAPERAVVERPPVGSGWMGVTVENVQTAPPGAGVPVRRGAVVVAVAPGSPAAAAGLRTGNVIVAIDGRVIRDAAGLIEEMGATVPGQEVEMSFYRGESLLRVPIRLGGEEGRIARQSAAESAAEPRRSDAPVGAPGGDLPGAAPGGGRIEPAEPEAGGAALPESQASADSTPRSDAPDAASDGAGAGDMLGGFGEALGGFFGGTTASPSADPQEPADGAPETPATPSPADSPADNPAVPPTAEPASGVPEPDVVPEPSAETIPLPAEEPDEVRQLLNKIEAMQRRIDVLERRLAEIESATPEG